MGLMERTDGNCPHTALVSALGVRCSCPARSRSVEPLWCLTGRSLKVLMRRAHGALQTCEARRLIGFADGIAVEVIALGLREEKQALW